MWITGPPSVKLEAVPGGGENFSNGGAVDCSGPAEKRWKRLPKLGQKARQETVEHRVLFAQRRYFPDGV